MYEKFTSILKRINWYRRKHGLSTLLRLSGQRFLNRWIIRSRYLFAVDLDRDSINSSQDFESVAVASYSSMEAIPAEDLAQLTERKGRSVLMPFLRHFFDYGARLWLVRIQNDIVGLKWTLKRGFDSFYCIPILETEVVSLAEQVFEDFRGQGVWKRMTAAILAELKKEGVSRVYFGVHCRNGPMLRAVSKAGISRLGKVLTISLWGKHLTIWDKHSLRNPAGKHPNPF